MRAGASTSPPDWWKIQFGISAKPQRGNVKIAAWKTSVGYSIRTPAFVGRPCAILRMPPLRRLPRTAPALRVKDLAQKSSSRRNRTAHGGAQMLLSGCRPSSHFSCCARLARTIKIPQSTRRLPAWRPACAGMIWVAAGTCGLRNSAEIRSSWAKWNHASTVAYSRLAPRSGGPTRASQAVSSTSSSRTAAGTAKRQKVCAPHSIQRSAYSKVCWSTSVLLAPYSMWRRPDTAARSTCSIVGSSDDSPQARSSILSFLNWHSRLATATTFSAHWTTSDWPVLGPTHEFAMPCISSRADGSQTADGSSITPMTKLSPCLSGNQLASRVGGTRYALCGCSVGTTARDHNR